MGTRSLISKQCDEGRPSCTNCLRTGSTCMYLGDGKSPTALTPTSVEESFRSPSSLPASQPTFDLLDLMLMSHFTAVTSLNLFSGVAQRQVWQIDVPSQAGSNAMLMHGLLAVSASHLVRLKPQQRSLYHVRAHHHHGLGLQLFNAEIHNLSSHNCDVLFTFSMLLIIWVYAFPAADGEVFSLNDILNMLDIVRGCKIVFKLHQDTILDKPIGKALSIEQSSPLPDLPPAAYQVFLRLRDRAADAVHLAAIDRLQRSFQRFLEGVDNMKSAPAWPANVEDSFWIRLRAHEPVSLLIFAHYALVLRYCEDCWWWMAGWSDRVIQAVDEALSSCDKVSLDWDFCLTQIRAPFVNASS